LVKQAVLKGYAVLAGVFVLGAVAGGGAAYAYVQKQYAEILANDDRRFDDRRQRALVRELDLTAEQRDQIHAINERYRSERREVMQSMMEKCGEPLAEQKKKMDAEIRAVLTGDQQKRFDELLEKQRDRMPFGGGGKGRPPGRRPHPPGE
jgi:Spy/CpxP family protein refolding chaperone